MPFEEIIRTISEEFTRAWNNWDKELLLRFLSNDIRLESPVVKEIYPENTRGEVRGKEQVSAYWDALALARRNIKVRQISIKKNKRVVETINEIIDTGQLIRETFILNEYGKILHLKYSYK